MYELIYYV